MAADKPKKFDETEKELEQYGSWVKGSSEDFEINDIDNDDFASVGDPNNALMTEEEEMLLNQLESSETESDSSFGDITFDEFEDLEDEMNDTFGMEHPDEDSSENNAQSSDLSVKILQNIESELVGLRNEVKELKSELGQIQRSPLDQSEISIDSDEQLTTGFFEEEDDDETIALTGDELDDILVSAEVEEETVDSVFEPDVDDLIISEEYDDTPEEFNELNILEEDEFQDTEDLIKDTELDNTLTDNLSLGEDDPALAELTETGFEDDIALDDEFVITESFNLEDDELEIPEDFDLSDIPDVTDETDMELDLDNIPEVSESFDIDGESFEVEEFDGLDGESFTVEEYSESEDSEEVAPPVVSESQEPSIEESYIEESHSEFDEGEEIDITIDEDDFKKVETKKDSVPFEDLEEIDLSSFDENLVVEEETDFEHVDLDSIMNEEDEITIDIEPENSDIEEIIDQSPIPDLDDIIMEEPDAEEITIDDTDEITLDEIDLDEITLEEDIELDLPDLDDIVIEDEISDDELDLPDLSDILDIPDLDNDIAEDELNLDEIELADLDDISIDEPDSGDLTLDEIDLDEIELPDLDDIPADESVNDESVNDEITLDEIELDEIELPDLDDIPADESVNDEITLDEIELGEIELPDLDDIPADESVNDEITLDEINLDEIIIEEESDENEIAFEETTQELDLPDIDEIILEEEANETDDLEIELPDLDDIVLDDTVEESIDEISLDDIILDEPDESIELPDLDEIIIDDLEDESIPDLDEIMADSSNESEQELSEIELPDMDDIILDDDMEIPEIPEESSIEPLKSESEDNIFGDDSETVDLDFLEQMAVEEDIEPETSESANEDFANELNEKVEEIRDAALKGNVPDELKEEIKDILLYMDQLLESLPDEKIQEFARSEHFTVYKKIFEELEIKK